jgi:hypothetical protein
MIYSSYDKTTFQATKLLVDSSTEGYADFAPDLKISTALKAAGYTVIDTVDYAGQKVTRAFSLRQLKSPCFDQAGLKSVSDLVAHARSLLESY